MAASTQQSTAASNSGPYYHKLYASASTTTAAQDQIFLYAPFLNLFGIFLTVVLCLTFLALGGITIKFLKVFACKIRIINKKAALKEGTAQDCKMVMDFSKSLEDDL